MRLSDRFRGGTLARGLFRWCRVCCLVGWLALPLTGWSHGALHDRIRELTAALAKNPNDVRLRFELADVYCQHGDWELALEQLAKVEALAPGQFPTGLDLVRGQALLTGGKNDEALAALDRFIAGQPANSVALLARARTHRKLGHDKPCAADYEAALRYSPELDIQIYSEFADFLAQRGRREEAVQKLSDGLAQLGPEPALLRQALALDLELERFDDALGRLTLLEKTAPRPEPLMAQRAAILSRAGRAEESRAAWTALLTHLDTLPNLERGSPAMRALASDARAALAAPRP